MTYDVVIVGGGASGLTAALFAARRGLKTLVVSQDLGGQASTAPVIENYPGVDSVSGPELMRRFRTQAERYGATVQFDLVKKIEKDGDDFRVVTGSDEHRTHTIVLAFGMTRRTLDVPGEAEFTGKGVSTNALHDAAAYAGKRVAVIGSGNSAACTALMLAARCSAVDVVAKYDQLRAEAVLVDRIANTKNIVIHPNSLITGILGDSHVTGITVKDATGAERTIETEGVFVDVGFTVDVSMLDGLVELDARKQIIITDANATNVPGVFAAGDVTTIGQKQVVISAGEGAKAALAAYSYLQSRGLVKKGGPIDWGESPK